MYIAEDSTFNRFDDPEALVWKEPGIVYGDWYGGPNGDSIYTKDTRFRPSEASYLHFNFTYFSAILDAALCLQLSLRPGVIPFLLSFFLSCFLLRDFQRI